MQKFSTIDRSRVLQQLAKVRSRHCSEPGTEPRRRSSPAQIDQVPVFAQTTAEGVAFTMEEPADGAPAPEVIEIDVKQEKGEKLMQEFDSPPMVVRIEAG